MIGDDVDIDVDADALEEELRELKRRKQTEAARSALASARAVKKVQDAAGSVRGAQKVLSAAETMQRRFLTGRLHHAFAISRSYEASTPDPKKNIQRDRARCAWSLLCSLARALDSILAIGEHGTPRFVINTIVPDDTTTRIRGPNPGDRALVHTIMNQVQTCVVTYEDCNVDDNPGWHCLAMPCPTTILHVADTANIHAAYSSYLISGATGLGRTWQSLGLSEAVNQGLSKAKWVVQVMCADALEANNSAFHIERQVLAHKRDIIGEDHDHNRVALRLRCNNHQLGLIRKPIVLGISNFWATLVRLAHLLECASFRRRFAAAILSFLRKPGNFESAWAQSRVMAIH